MPSNLPQHRIDAPITYIHRSDPAWDMERVEAEMADYDSEVNVYHPVVQYASGFTRYDLTAPCKWGEDQEGCAQDYLKSDVHPRRWELRRLGWQEFHAVQDLVSLAANQGVKPTQGYLRAAKLGVVAVDGGEKIDLGKTKGGLSEAAMSNIHDQGITEGCLLLHDLGHAVWMSSLPLTEREGKL